MENRIREVRRERDSYRQKFALAQWRYDSLRARKWWRLGEEIQQVRGRPWRLFMLPARLLRIILSSSIRVPKPDVESDGMPGEDRELTPVERAERHFADNQYRQALQCLDQALARNPRNVPALDLRRQVEVQLGEISSALATTRRIRYLSGAAKYRRVERFLEGRVQELTPGWLPVVPTRRPINYRPRSPGTVLHVLKASVPFATAGSTMRSFYMVDSQRALGLNPVVSTAIGFPRNRGVSEFQSTDTIRGVRYIRVDPGSGYDPDSVPVDEQLKTWTWLAARIVEAERPALLHAGSGHRGYENALVSLALGRHFELPVIYEVRSFHEATWTHDWDIAETGEVYKRRVEIENFCMIQADAVVTLAETMKNELVERGVPPEKVSVIGNAVDPEKFRPQPAPTELLRQMGFRDRIVVGYISNLSRREGVDVLLHAVAEVLDEGQPVACLIVGEGRERAALEQLARTLGIAQQVVFTGEVPHGSIRDYYAAIDVFVVPRRDDRAARLVTPLKPFEAMAMARPLIVSDLPALAQIVGPEQRGLVFDPADPMSLARRIKELIDQPEHRKRLGERGREWVLSNRTWQENAKRYRELYTELVGSLVHFDTANSDRARHE